MLILPIKKKWFDLILSKEKTEEYREIKDYYKHRFEDWFGISTDDLKKYFVSTQQQVVIRNGYKKTSPTAVIDCFLKVDFGKEEFGAEPGKLYYVLVISDAFIVDPTKKFGVWEIQEEKAVTPGGDPIYLCPECKEKHIFGIENQFPRIACKTCGKFMVYPWQCIRSEICEVWK